MTPLNTQSLLVTLKHLSESYFVSFERIDRLVSHLSKTICLQLLGSASLVEEPILDARLHPGGS